MTDLELLDTIVIGRLEQELGEELLVTLFNVFVEETLKHLELLKQALAEENQEEIIRLTHSIKSGALTYGAAQLAELASKHEKWARGNHKDKILSDLTQLDESIKSTVEAISNRSQT